MQGKTITNILMLSGETWVFEFKEFDFLDGYLSVLDVQDYFEYIIKEHNLPIQIYINKIEYKITLKIK